MVRGLMKILIADDSAILRERLANLLNDLDGIESIEQAEDTTTARELVQKMKPDVAILDVRIPKGGGIDLLHDIRKRAHPSTTIIMLTNYAFAETRDKCIGGGANYFFDKSTEFMKVVAVLRGMLSRPTQLKVRRRPDPN
jgi:DNA-binding NarL/FixJ family response regulator